MSRQSARFYSLAATATIAFIVWVSLFPFAFNRIPWVNALVLFWRTRVLMFDVAAWSVTDIVSNAALFVPFGLFVSGVVAEKWLIRRSLLWIISSSLLLSASLEFAQAFVIWRKPSLLDVAASMAGAIAGARLWRRFRPEVNGFATLVEQMWDAWGSQQRSLLLYSGIFACAWLFPFDLTIRPDEIRDKYEHQRLLLPLSTSPDAATSSRLWLTLVAAIPVGMASRVCAGRSSAPRTLTGAIAVAVVLLLVLEIVQVSVFSRTTDVTELLVAVPGVVVGAYVAHQAGSSQ
jgi:glycopeptide antibiotics resistance protein